MKKILFFIASIALTSNVIAQPAEAVQRFNKSVFSVLKQLDLSEQQKEDVRTLFRNNREDQAIYCTDSKQFKIDMRKLIEADTFDEAAVREVIQGHASIQQDIAYTRAMTKHNIWLLLTEDQQAQLEEITQARLVKRAERNSGVDRDARMLERLAPRLDLTDEQYVEIIAIRESFAEQIAEFSGNMQVFKQSERDIIRADAFDQQAWEVLFADYQVVATEVAVLRANMRHQLSQVLTDEQARKLKKLRKKIKQKRGSR